MLPPDGAIRQKELNDGKEEESDEEVEEGQNPATREAP
jgi:hypothetical protein